MQAFEIAVERLLKEEGGYVNSPSDSGGATNFGISLRFLREIPLERLRKYGIFEPLDENTIKNLMQPQAVMIYGHEFWEPAKLELLDSYRISSYVLDMCAHHGIGQGIKLLQRATWAVLERMDGLVDDGIMGEKTIQEVNRLCANEEMYPALCAALCAERAGFCRMVAEIRPKDRENINGWLKRCYRF